MRMSSTYSVLQENVIPPSKIGSSIVILTQTLGKEFPYSTLEYGNSSPRVWVRITILLPPSEGGMYHSLQAHSNMANSYTRRANQVFVYFFKQEVI